MFEAIYLLTLYTIMNDYSLCMKNLIILIKNNNRIWYKGSKRGLILLIFTLKGIPVL